MWHTRFLKTAKPAHAYKHHRCPVEMISPAVWWYCRCFRTRLKGLTDGPRVMMTAKLASSGAAKWELMPSLEHREHRDLTNRAENSHQPTRQRERRMPRFKSPGHVQRFLAA